MSRAKSDIEKKTLNLRRGDWDYIESIAHPQGLPTSEVVRLIVSNYVDKKRATESPRDLNALDIELE